MSTSKKFMHNIPMLRPLGVSLMVALMTGCFGRTPTAEIAVVQQDKSVPAENAELELTSAATEVYPDPDSAYRSQLFKVEVKVNGIWRETATYQYTRKSLDWAYHGGSYPWVHWAKLGTNASAEVRVTRLSRSWGANPFDYVEIIPYRYGISPTYTSNIITFTMSRNQNVYVNINKGAV